MAPFFRHGVFVTENVTKNYKTLILKILYCQTVKIQNHSELQALYRLHILLLVLVLVGHNVFQQVYHSIQIIAKYYSQHEEKKLNLHTIFKSY